MISLMDELENLLRSSVGRVGVRELMAAARRVMVAEALARTGGNRRAAARLLGVSRQTLQHMVRRLEGDRSGIRQVARRRQIDYSARSLLGGLAVDA
jgi:DNA-binding NtrC family response regulator